MEEEKKVKKSTKKNVEVDRSKESAANKTNKIAKKSKPTTKTVDNNEKLQSEKKVSVAAIKPKTVTKAVRSTEKSQAEKKVSVAAIKPKTVTKAVRSTEKLQSEKKVSAAQKKSASQVKATNKNTSAINNEKIENKKKSTASKKVAVDDKNVKEVPKVAKKTTSSSKVKKVATRNLREEIDDILGEAFESSSRAVKESKNIKKAKSSSAKKGEPTHKETSVKRAQKRASSTGTAKNSTKTSTKKSGTSKAANVKKRITEEVSKAVSEKSSKIKIKNNKSVTKEDIEKITTNIEKENEEKEVTKQERPASIDELNLQELDEELYLRKSLPKDVFTKILKKSSLSVIYAIGFMLFLIFNNYGYYHIAGASFMNILKACSFVFLGIALILFEISFKKESASKCVIGIETLVFAILTLSLPYIYQIYHGTFTNLLKSAGIIIFGYSIVKACITFYNSQNKYFREQDNLVIEDDDNEFNEDDEDEE